MREIRGVHVIVDGYVADAKVFDATTMREMFDKLVSALKMQYLTPPLCCDVPLEEGKLNTEEDEGGRSWFCQITTSHIALHGWPLRKAFMMDIFSCKPFDTALAMSILREHLNLTAWSMYVLDRFDPNLQDRGPSPSILVESVAHTKAPSSL